MDKQAALEVGDVRAFGVSSGGQNTNCSYVDFAPTCLKEIGFMRLPQYERFNILFDRGNAWLAANPNMKVINCESFDTECDCTLPPTKRDPNKSTYIDMANRPNAFIRLLRLWVSPKGRDDSPVPVRLGYLNVVPACLDNGGFFKPAVFETFDVTLSKLNDMLRARPLEGKIINVETQQLRVTEMKGVDPDESFWFGSSKGPTYFLVVLRIFYEAAPPAMEVIGYVDMVPNATKRGYDTEPFSSLAQRARQWIRENQGVRVTNVQSINYKVDHTWSGKRHPTDTKQALFYKMKGPGGMAMVHPGDTVFHRILRIAFVQPGYGSAYSGYQGAAPALSYRTFLPALVRPGRTCGWCLYEPMSNNYQRLMAWLNYTGARVLSMETISLIVDNQARCIDADDTFTLNRGSRNELVVFAFRVYLDGDYTDPPATLLPPLPEQEESSCCTIL